MKLEFEYFSKICRKNENFVTIWQELRLLYMKPNIYFWSYLAQLFLEWELFRTKVVENFKTHVLCSVLLFRKSCRCEWICKNIIEPSRPQMTIRRKCVACWIPRTTNTHSSYVILIAGPLQQWLPARASVLRYTYIAYLVNILHVLPHLSTYRYIFL
jgi:hypothetical protein